MISPSTATAIVANITKPGLTLNEQIAALNTNGYDYANQAWVVDGKYIACGHPEFMNCDCFGKVHAGEAVKPNANIH